MDMDSDGDYNYGMGFRDMFSLWGGYYGRLIVCVRVCVCVCVFVSQETLLDMLKCMGDFVSSTGDGLKRLSETELPVFQQQLARVIVELHLTNSTFDTYLQSLRLLNSKDRQREMSKEKSASPSGTVVVSTMPPKPCPILSNQHLRSRAQGNAAQLLKTLMEKKKLKLSSQLETLLTNHISFMFLLRVHVLPHHIFFISMPPHLV